MNEDIYKIMSTAEKTDLRQKMGQVCNIASSLFNSECARLGVPSSEEEVQRLIDKCFITSQTLCDYLDKKIEPFL